MKRVGWLWLAALALFVGGVLGVQEREVTLRFQFVPNQIRTYEQRVDGEMAVTMQVAGQEVAFTMTAKGEMTETERIESVDKEGVATFVVTSKGRMKLETSGLPPEAEVPPEEEEEIPPTTVRLKVNPLGKIVEAKMERLPEKVAAPSSPFKGSLPAFQIQGALWHSVLFPEKPVRVGDSWDMSGSMDFTVKDRTVKVDYKGSGRLLAFEKVDERECAVVETTSEIPDLSDLIVGFFPEEARKSGVQIHVSTEGKMTGKVWFDIANGLSVRSSETTDMTSNVSLSLPTGQSFSISMQGTFRRERRLVKVAEAKVEK